MTMFISYEASYETRKVCQWAIPSQQKDETYIKRIIDQILRRLRKQIKTRQRKVHMVVNIRLQEAMSTEFDVCPIETNKLTK